MARKGSPTDYDVTVEGIGNFKFARRTFKDEIAIQVEYARIIDGVTPTDWLATIAGWLAPFRVLIVKAPDIFDIDAIDPLEDEGYAMLANVFAAFQAKELSFRKRKAQVGEAPGQAEGPDGGVLVPAEVPADA